MRWFLSNVCLGNSQTDVGVKCPAHGARRVEQPKGEGKDEEEIPLKLKTNCEGRIPRPEARAQVHGHTLPPGLTAGREDEKRGSTTRQTSESALARRQNTGRFSAWVRLARHCLQRLSRHATATKNNAARQVRRPEPSCCQTLPNSLSPMRATFSPCRQAQGACDQAERRERPERATRLCGGVDFEYPIRYWKNTQTSVHEERCCERRRRRDKDCRLRRTYE